MPAESGRSRSFANAKGKVNEHVYNKHPHTYTTYIYIHISIIYIYNKNLAITNDNYKLTPGQSFANGLHTVPLDPEGGLLAYNNRC